MPRVRLVLLVIGLLSLAACGPTVARRPLFLDIAGVSGDAEKLVVKLVDGEKDVACTAVTLETAPSVAADQELVWVRSSGAERVLSFDEVDLESFTLLVYTEDAQMVPIQLACQELTYADIEIPDRTIELERP